ncbi:SUKH-4 family immunity protein [Kitasatospora sp. NPDC089509]|uniref:SUKH-4 family immunity protein n=1 Tax=Kitasatospora sp. NPDC089509 TaxID=3364079 RepID=UPI0037FDCCF3
MAEHADRELNSEINALWDDQLKAIPAEWIPRDAAPNVAEFLTVVGLPTTEVKGIAFVHDKRMSHLIEHLDRGYLLLATTGGLPFVADPIDGQVGTFVGGRSPRLLFVGSSLPQFLVALGIWRRDLWAPPAATRTAEYLLSACAQFERVLADRDPAAVKAGAYWPGLLGGLREGIEL